MKIIKTILICLGSVVFFWHCSKDTASEAISPTGIGGSTARFTISNNHLYTVDSRDLHIFSLSNPAQPVAAGKYNVGSDVETIYPYKNNLFIGSRSAMYIYNVTNPLVPALQSEVSHVITSCDPVVADDKYAFVTLSMMSACNRGINQLEVIDISNLNNARTVMTYGMSQPKGLALDGNLLFVADNGIKMYDRTNVMQLQLKQHILSVPANDIIADNQQLIVTASNGIHQYGYSSGQLVPLSTISSIP